MSAANIMRALESVEMPKITSHGSFIAALKFMHGLMRASGSLLEIAIAKSKGPLHEYYWNQLGEEAQHADWLAEDLKVLGETPIAIDHAAAATAGAQYYYLHHVGPHALLGYIAALEFRPMPLPVVEALEKVYGGRALRTVRHHAEADVEHAKTLARVIDQHEEFASIITYNAFVTAKMVAFHLNDRMKAGGV
jgi:hypothetical protein